MAKEDPARVLRAEVTLQDRLEEVAEGCGGHDDGAEHQRTPGLVEEILLIEGEKRREHACDRPGREAFPRLPGRDDRGHLVPSRESSGKKGDRVRHEHGQEDRDGSKPAVWIERADEDQVPEAQPDPAGP